MGLMLDEVLKKALEYHGSDLFVVPGSPIVTKAGGKMIRITEDRNGNGLVDTGSILEHRQPEKVMFYKVDGQFLIDIPERAEYVQTINLEELFQ